MNFCQLYLLVHMGHDYETDIIVDCSKIVKVIKIFLLPIN